MNCGHSFFICTPVRRDSSTAADRDFAIAEQNCEYSHLAHEISFCDDCTLDARGRIDDAHLVSLGLSPATMQGTARQVAYAKIVRAAKCRVLHDFIERGRTIGAKDFRSIAEGLLAAMLRTEKSKWFLDKKDMSIPDMMASYAQRYADRYGEIAFYPTDRFFRQNAEKYFGVESLPHSKIPGTNRLRPHLVFKNHHVFTIYEKSLAERKDITEWCIEHCGEFISQDSSFYFVEQKEHNITVTIKDETLALAFKMRWL